MTILVVTEQEKATVRKFYDTAVPTVRKTPVTSITRSGSTATVTKANHGFTTGDVVTISGASQTLYNGAWTITVADANTFTFSVLPATPATGTITVNGAAVASITRSGTTATATRVAHGLANGASVTIAGADQAAYNGTFVITVGGDPDVFTYTVALPATPATPSAEAIYAENPNQSQVLNSPKAIQIESIAGGTTVKLEVAITLAQGWKQLGADLTSSDNGSIIPITTPYNFVRLRRSTGSGAVKAHVQP